MGYLRRGMWVAVFVAALVGGWNFADRNAAPVRVDYLFGEFGSMPLWLALLSSFAVGAGVAALGLFARLTRASLAQRRYRKTVAALESEVHQLRNLPVSADDAVVSLPEPPASRAAGGDAVTLPAEAVR